MIVIAMNYILGIHESMREAPEGGEFEQKIINGDCRCTNRTYPWVLFTNVANVIGLAEGVGCLTSVK